MCLHTDGPTSLRVTLPGEGADVRPTGWVAAKALSGYRNLPPGPAVQPLTSLDFTRRTGTYAVLAVQNHVPYAADAHVSKFCLSTRLQPCGPSAYQPPSSSGVGVGTPGDARIFAGQTAYFVRDSFGGPYGAVTASLNEVDNSLQHEVFWFAANI